MIPALAAGFVLAFVLISFALGAWCLVGEAVEGARLRRDGPRYLEPLELLAIEGPVAWECPYGPDACLGCWIEQEDERSHR